MCFFVFGAGSVWGQTPTAPALSPTYADLVERSKALTPDQKNQAQQMFNTGFTLWQSGDFASATQAFKEGLDIDPANSQANYYYGDCLRQAKHRNEAIEYFKRANALGGGSPERFKAKAALDELAKPPTVDEMSSEELKDLYVGTWNEFGEGDREFKISKDAKGDLIISGSFYRFLAGTFYFMDLTFDGKQITFFINEPKFARTLHLVSPDKMEGSQNPSSIKDFATRLKK
jgi:tetratricopeptide (TPR) repeat protein